MEMNTRIKEIMHTKGMNNVILAEKMGVSKQAAGKMINAESLTTATLEKISLALDVPIWQLFISPEDAAGEDSSDFCAFIRWKGIHYTADTEDEFWRIVDELRMMAGRQ